MVSYSVLKYNSDYKIQWDEFITHSKNATFLFYRDFIEYHGNRFQDHSLLIFKNQKLIALMPANIENDILHSHQGLTYGGFVFEKSIVFKECFDVFKSVLKFLENKRIRTIKLKQLPKIYSLLPSDEIKYLLFLARAKLTRCDLSTSIDRDFPLGVQSSNRKRGIKKGKKNNLQINEEQNFQDFWDRILIPTLKEVHGESPVHSFQEIQLLKNKFPKNIRLFSVLKDASMIAGCLIFETEKVAHAQYISSNSDGRGMGALDFLFDHLIHEEFKNKKYFDLGTSNENQGRSINEGLLHWKESFGARSIVHEFYEIPTANHIYLKDVFL